MWTQMGNSMPIIIMVCLIMGAHLESRHCFPFSMIRREGDVPSKRSHISPQLKSCHSSEALKRSPNPFSSFEATKNSKEVTDERRNIVKFPSPKVDSSSGLMSFSTNDSEAEEEAGKLLSRTLYSSFSFSLPALFVLKRST